MTRVVNRYSGENREIEMAIDTARSLDEMLKCRKKY